jgi:hypothetical protein
LPVGYFHLVFTLPGPIADIAFQNKAVIYDLLFKASSEAMLRIAADPKHLGPHERVEGPSLPASENLHICRYRTERCETRGRCRPSEEW